MDSVWKFIVVMVIVIVFTLLGIFLEESSKKEPDEKRRKNKQIRAARTFGILIVFVAGIYLGFTAKFG